MQYNSVNLKKWSFDTLIRIGKKLVTVPLSINPRNFNPLEAVPSMILPVITPFMWNKNIFVPIYQNHLGWKVCQLKGLCH